MPERQPSVIRAATTGERISDRVRDAYEAIAEQPLGQIADLLGLTNFKGMVDRFSNPEAEAPGFGIPLMGGAIRRTPGAKAFGAAGHRIPKGSQSSMASENKIPRFRSEHGTFIKHEGAWWRIGKQPSDPSQLLLEKLPSGEELAAGAEPTVLDSRLVSADVLMPKRAKPGK